MRPFSPQYIRRVHNTFKATAKQSTRVYSVSKPIKMSDDSKGELRIENNNINTREGVSLSESQKTLVGSVLDLFAGRPSLAKLQLWTDDAIFEDPITVAKGRKQYEPQWYGLQTAFSEIERLHHEVTSAGNPIEIDMKTRYVIKGINKEQTIASKINIFTEGDKITKVEDKWDGKLPESGIQNVSSVWQLINPFWWVRYAEGWAFWGWSFVWYTTPWMVSRCGSLVQSWLNFAPNMYLFFSRYLSLASSCADCDILCIRLSDVLTPTPSPRWSGCRQMRKRTRREGIDFWSVEQANGHPKEQRNQYIEHVSI